jgi:hypothetical protein
MIRKLIVVALGAIVATNAFSQDYSNHAQLTQRLKALEAAHPDLAKLQSLAQTAGGKAIWMLEIGSGDRSDHPAVAVVGGVEGSHILGPELAVGFAEKLLAGARNDSIKALLASTTFYVFANVSPDATEQYFAKVKYERSANASATDDDRDGRTNEDPFEDLNSDGLISMVRIEDPAGKWIMHPADPRIMIQANPEKGEKGKYVLLTEGIDNDQDNVPNEDGEGGVHFNKSLTFDPPYFTPGAGEHPVSEPENRAVLDFLFEHFNVFVVLTFGPANNLAEPWKFDRSKGGGRIPTGITESDSKYNKLMSELYKKSVKQKDAPAAGVQKGDFVQWAYFHYGRQSYSTPGWWVPRFEIPKDSVSAKKNKANEDKNTDVDFIRWAEKEQLDVFINWQKINHPDYPGKHAEAGGFKPFVKTTPPFKMVSKIVDEHSKFVVALANAKPEAALVNLKTEALEGGITRVTVVVQNKGLLPALADVGRNNNFIKLVKINLVLAKDQTVLTGNKVTLLPNLDAGESKELTWLVKGKGKAVIEAGAPQMGVVKLDVNL